MNDIDRQIMALLEEKERRRLEAGRLAGNRDEDHQPIYYLVPGAMQQVGCSCGYQAKRPNQRTSTMFNSYAAHRRNLGLARMDYYDPRYTEGPAKGMTWEEAQKAGVSVRWIPLQ
jgi:hypothetical protein